MKKCLFLALFVAFFVTIGYVDQAYAAEIGNTVWHDRNKNGKQDPNEEGIADVRVKLYNGNDVETDKTNARGRYKFSDLEPGSYTIVVAQETLPSGCYATYDRDGNKNGKYEKYLTEDNSFTHADFGYYCPTSAQIHKKSPATGSGVIVLVISLAIAFGAGLTAYHARTLKKVDNK